VVFKQIFGKGGGVILPKERDRFLGLLVDTRIVFIQVLEKFYVRVSSGFSCCSMCISLVVMKDDVKPPCWVNGFQHGSAPVFLVCKPLKTKVTCPQKARNHLQSDAILWSSVTLFWKLKNLHLSKFHKSIQKKPARCNSVSKFIIPCLCEAQHVSGDNKARNMLSFT
jgi:hypothetical protein